MPLSMQNLLVPADGVNFNNLLSFVSSTAINVTNHPVEFGTDVSDHAQVQPIELIFAVQITKTPLFLPNVTTIEQAQSWFERNAGKQLIITAPAGIFTGFVISRFSHDERQGQRVWNVTARQIRTAAAVSAPIPPRVPNPVAATGLASASSSGTQAPVPVDASGFATLFGLVTP